MAFKQFELLDTGHSIFSLYYFFLLLGEV